MIAAFLWGCKPRFKIQPQAYIIGENNIKVMENPKTSGLPNHILNSSAVLTTSVGENRRKFCSGTIVPPEKEGQNVRILTNHHCFIEFEEDMSASGELLPGHCSSTKVYLNFFKNPEHTPVILECKEGTFRSDPGGDLAVFEVKKNPPAPYTPAKFWTGPDPEEKREALIIHYPFIDADDPNKSTNGRIEPTSGIYLPYAQITEESCETGGFFPRDEWQFDPALPVSLKHNCDQKKGSSGSALWDKQTATVIGVNWGGIILTYSNQPEDSTYNVATKVTYVLDFLNQENSTPHPATVSPPLSSADAVAIEKDSASKQDKPKALCGTLSGGSSDSHWLLVLPMIVLAFWRRSDVPSKTAMDSEDL